MIKFKDKLKLIHWEKWNLVPADSQNNAEYVSLLQIIEANFDLADASNLINNKTVQEFIIDPSKRPQKIHNEIELVFILKFLMCSAFLVMTLGLLNNSDNGSLIISISFFLTCCFAFFAAFFQQKVLKQKRIITQKPLTYFFKKEHALVAIDVSQFLHIFRTNQLLLFTLEADGLIYRINIAYWMADNWEIGLLGDGIVRQAVSLSTSPPPSGEALFLKSELEKYGILYKRVGKLETTSIAKTKNKAALSENIYVNLGMPPNWRWCPFLRSVQSQIGLMKKLVKAGDQKIKNRSIDPRFIPCINAYKVILESSQNWIKYLKGNLDLSIEKELMKKLRYALCPEEPDSKEAYKRLKAFLKPNIRSLDKFVASLNIVNSKLIDEQITLYLETKK